MFINILITTALVLKCAAVLPPSCFSPVYCYGPLLHTVQMEKVFVDSKDFVDLKMKTNSTVVLENYGNFMKNTNGTPTRDEVSNFVHENFEDGNELDKWTPTDYKPDPAFLQNIDDEVIKNFAQEIVHLWPTLGRKVKDDVFEDPSKYSLIPVPNGFVIPGGRFREYYYWDSYWIIKGLLISEMTETAKGMIDNFFYIVKQFGFIPNGGRVYYLNRSQPPLLTKMAGIYFKYTGDIEWLRSNIQYLETELRFWLTKRTVKIQKGDRLYTMARYAAESKGPRPESYYQDFTTASYYSNDSDKDQLYNNLKSGAESGWDFSSRWIVDSNGGNEGNLTNLKTQRIIPVDLNSYLCESFFLMSYFYDELSESNSSAHWNMLGNYWKKSIKEVMWNENDGIWYDFDKDLMEQRKCFFPSNLAPLWTNSVDESEQSQSADRALKYLDALDILSYTGGVPTSLGHTGEQWDFPNSWAPLQSIVVQALLKSKTPQTIEIAKDMARRWVKANLIGFRESGEIFEKYDAVLPGKFGGGGEYVVQAGFGWTNGVALEFINDFFSNRRTN